VEANAFCCVVLRATNAAKQQQRSGRRRRCPPARATRLPHWHGCCSWSDDTTILQKHGGMRIQPRARATAKHTPPTGTPPQKKAHLLRGVAGGGGALSASLSALHCHNDAHTLLLGHRGDLTSRGGSGGGGCHHTVGQRPPEEGVCGGRSRGAHQRLHRGCAAAGSLERCCGLACVAAAGPADALLDVGGLFKFKLYIRQCV